MTIEAETSDPGEATRAPARRTQRRISAQIPIRVYRPGSSVPIMAMNQDLSWGGAQFVATVPLVWMTGRLRLDLPWTSGQAISLEGEVVRAQQLSGGVSQVAVRFVSVPTRSQARLEKLLTMLDGGGAAPGSQAEPLFSGLEMSIEDPDEMRRTLEQISADRLAVQVKQLYQQGQSIALSVQGAKGLPSFKLRARVMAANRVPSASPGELYGLVLGFEHPPAAMQELARQLIAQITEGGSGAKPVGPAPGEAKADEAHLVEPTAFPPTGRPLDAASLSALESRHRDVVQSLMLHWGNPEDFDALFRELTFGNRAEPGGWSPEVWDELGFLQDVHDLAYGLPSFRASVVIPGRVR